MNVNDTITGSMPPGGHCATWHIQMLCAYSLGSSQVCNDDILEQYQIFNYTFEATTQTHVWGDYKRPKRPWFIAFDTKDSFKQKVRHIFAQIGDMERYGNFFSPFCSPYISVFACERLVAGFQLVILTLPCVKYVIP